MYDQHAKLISIDEPSCVASGLAELVWPDSETFAKVSVFDIVTISADMVSDSRNFGLSQMECPWGLAFHSPLAIIKLAVGVHTYVLHIPHSTPCRPPVAMWMHGNVLVRWWLEIPIEQRRS